jgi:hypothetical protein
VIARDHDLVAMGEREDERRRLLDLLEVASARHVASVDEDVPSRHDEIPMEQMRVRDGDDPHW